MILAGPRVTLRPWREVDREAFAAMNADPAVMRHFPHPLSRAESDAFLDRIAAHHAEHGFGFWCAEVEGEVAGLCGPLRVPWEAPFSPAVEVGWRFLTRHHGRGLAREAAALALDDAFGRLGLKRVVAFTIPANAPSRRLMERLGLERRGLFDHPRLPKGHPMRRHVWYELRREAWRG